MQYLSVAETAKNWQLSERSVRNYCAKGRIPGAFLTGKTWNIPADAEKPARSPRSSTKPDTLLSVLRREMESGLSGGIYHRLQIDLTYNSNHMEGSCLTHEQTRYIFETNTIGISEEGVQVDDIVEAVNHFRCIDFVLAHAEAKLTEKLLHQLHALLKSGTSDSRKGYFAVGAYKRMPNEVGGRETTPPEQVAEEIQALLDAYNALSERTLEELLAFHVGFERIHPYQDGNGRIGRLLLLKECLKYDIVPFIITDDLKLFYYRGLQNWDEEQGYLTDTCLLAQDRFCALLEYFRIPFVRE